MSDLTHHHAAHFFAPPLSQRPVHAARGEQARCIRIGNMVRCVRIGDADFSLYTGDEVGLTIDLTDQFLFRGREGHRSIDRHGSVGNVFINSPGQQLDFAIRGSFRAIQFALPSSLICAVALEDFELDPSRTEIRPLAGGSDVKILDLSIQAVRCTGGERLAEILRDLVAHLLVAYSPSRRSVARVARAGLPPVRMRRVRDLVECDLAAVTVAAMAAEAELSPFHFAREFKRTTGLTPWEYVVYRRLSRAIGLLDDQAKSLRDVARLSGFADASHLAHRMRDRFRCSPSELRKHLLL